MNEVEKLKKSLENAFKDAIQNGSIKIINGNEKLFEIINDVMINRSIDCQITETSDKSWNNALNRIVKLAIKNGIIDYDEYYYDNGEVIISISELKEIVNKLKR